MPYFYSGRLIREGRGWVDAKSVKHPTNWASWSDEEKTAKGLVWQAPPAPYDSRFWWDAETPKDIATLKPEWVAQVKQQAGSLLAQTDWYVTREAETGKRMPPKVLAYRDAVRATADGVIADLEAAVDHAEFVAIATSFAWPDPDAEMTEAELLAAERKGMRCSAMQARAALEEAGLLTKVEALIAQAGKKAGIAWTHAVEFRRNSRTIRQLAAHPDINMSDAQLDALFRAAMQIEA